MEHSVFNPDLANKAVTKRFRAMQDLIQDHRKQEERNGDRERTKLLFSTNPYLSLKDPLDSEADEEPLELQDKDAPSPRHS